MRYMRARQGVSNPCQDAEEHPSSSAPPLQANPFRPDAEEEMTPVHPRKLLPPLSAAFLQAPVKNFENSLPLSHTKKTQRKNVPPSLLGKRVSGLGASPNRRRRRTLYHQFREALITEATPMWVGRRGKLKRFARQFVRRYQGNERFLTTALGSAAKLAGLALLMLSLYAAPVSADPKFIGSINPFGLSTVQNSLSNPSFVDIDGDGDLDAFVGEYNGSVVYFENTGSSSAPAFATSSNNPFGLADVGGYSAPTFVDIDGDGDLDAFVGEYDGDVKYFENTGTSSAPAFATSSDNPFGLANIGDFSTPEFVDIDGDGDLDAFVGEYDGYVKFFENIGTSSAPTFTTSSDNPFGLADVGDYSAPVFVDIDGDGDLDAFVGEEYGYLKYFENTGSSNSPAFATSSDNPFGLATIGYFSTPEFVDIDGDGDLDALVGHLFGSEKYFENTGSSSSPAFVGANPFGLADVGDYSTPTFVDIDGDGDLDAFVGEDYGNVKYFENTGTSSSPAFAASSNNPFNLTDVGDYSSPAFVDIDGDGDLDAFVGETYGDVKYFENTGSSSSPAFATSSNNPFNLTDVGDYNSPTFVDIDGDGDLDAFVGEEYGDVKYFENTGSSSTPAFDTSSDNPFGLANVGGYGSPVFVDIDGDGDLDALVGNSGGYIEFFENTGSSSAPAFAASVYDPFGLSDTFGKNSPEFVDIDGDGDLDAFVGDNIGNMDFFRNVSPSISIFSPSDNATNEAVSTDLVLTFSSAITAQSGKNITLKRTDNDAVLETISVTGAAVLGSGTSIVSVNPTSDLPSGTGVYVVIDADAFRDADDVSLPGIPTTTTWNFSTASNQTPTATAATETVNEDTDATITLGGSDGDGDSMTATIVSLPADGSLFQTSDGITKGTQITAANTAVTDASRRVIYTPSSDNNGSGVGDFTFLVNDGTINSSSATITVDVTSVNDIPTITAIADPAAILEDAGAQTVNLSGIGEGGSSESQTLTVTATSSNTDLIPNPTVTYTSPDATGTLTYTPVAHESGTATITVTVTDDGDTSNGGDDTVSETFTVTVTGVNDIPTLSDISDPAAILEDAGAQTVNLSGIGEGGSSESQTLTVTATSSNTDLIPNPTVTYTSPDATGTLTYTPVAHESGTATITVTVTDDGDTSNGGDDTISETFTVTVTGVNDIPTSVTFQTPLPSSKMQVLKRSTCLALAREDRVRARH